VLHLTGLKAARPTDARHIPFSKITKSCAWFYFIGAVQKDIFSWCAPPPSFTSGGWAVFLSLYCCKCRRFCWSRRAGRNAYVLLVTGEDGTVSLCVASVVGLSTRGCPSSCAVDAPSSQTQRTERFSLAMAVGIRFAPPPGIRSRSSIWDQKAPSSAKYSRSVEAYKLLLRAHGGFAF